MKYKYTFSEVNSLLYELKPIVTEMVMKAVTMQLITLRGINYKSRADSFKEEL